MEKNKQQTDIITDNFVSDIRTIIEQGRKQAYAATGQIAIMTYWNIGRRIVEEEQQGASRAAYGQKLIPALAVRLAAEYGTGYGKRNLAYYRKFYLEFKDVEILHTRVQNFYILEFQIELSVICQVTLTIAGSVFSSKSDSKSRNKLLSVCRPACPLLFFFHDTPSNVPISHNGYLTSCGISLFPSLFYDGSDVGNEIISYYVSLLLILFHIPKF